MYTVPSAEVSISSVTTATIGTASSANSIRNPWKKSVQQTALKPPRNVYTSIISANIVIAARSDNPGNTVVNTDVPATKLDATYIVKHTKNITAQIICSAGLDDANLFDRYCGSVIASFEALENFLSLFATNIQFAMVPSPRPIPIHI